MYASNLKFFCIFAALLAALTAASTLHAAMNSVNNHMSGQACTLCHLSDDAINKGNAHLLVAPQEKLCTAFCHPNSVQISHPSGIRPLFAVPPVYPLDWKGDMTCSTCHNVHGSTPGLMRGSARGHDLCLSCHDRGFFDKMADHGASMISSGHLPAGAAKIGMNKLNVDPFTVQCVSCHDDCISSLGATINFRQTLRHANKSVNHPIGWRYAESFTRGRYKPELTVNQNLYLPGGQLSCVSCHRGYAKEHGKLWVGTQNGALCLGCHDL